MESSELKPSKVYQLPYLVDYVSGSVVTRSVMMKKTGSVSLSCFDKGEILVTNTSPFDNLILIIEGVAEIIIDEKTTQLKLGQIMIIPAHAPNKIKARVRCKMLSTIIKSGYEDVSI